MFFKQKKLHIYALYVLDKMLLFLLLPVWNLGKIVRVSLQNFPLLIGVIERVRSLQHIEQLSGTFLKCMF